MADELARLDATAQAELVRSGELTPLELVDAAIERIERVNPELNAVIHRLDAKARAAAASPALPDGPFRGVPFLVKDAVCHTDGDPYHLGMRFLKSRKHVARGDTELARRLRAAGFVFVGKTNTPELAMSVTTEPLAYGATRNPWAPDHSPGGSSGGSASAVAAGLAPVAHANDMGGSIRIPASECGLVGLKPTRARGTLGAGLRRVLGPAHARARGDALGARLRGGARRDRGPGAGRSVHRARAAAGRSRARSARSPARCASASCVESGLAEIHPECARAVDLTAALLGELGHRVEPAQHRRARRAASRPTPGSARRSRTISTASGARSARRSDPDDLEPMNWMIAENGRRLSAVDYVAAAEAGQAWARRIQQWWADGHDVLSPRP